MFDGTSAAVFFLINFTYSSVRANNSSILKLVFRS